MTIAIDSPILLFRIIVAQFLGSADQENDQADDTELMPKDR